MNFFKSRLTHSQEESPFVYYQPQQIPKYNPYINLVLFIITVFTTIAAGALMEGVDIFSDLGDLTKGIPFSLTLLLILGCHEFGHYIASKRWGVDATLPYFIPAPTIIGTFGAFIKMRSPIPNRSALLSIGASGPLAGFVVAIPIIIIGLAKSTVIEVAEIQEGSMTLGDSLLFTFLSKLVIGDLQEGYDVYLHPIAFAGWIGLFVTMLNLLPIGQLDGGHISFAILGRKFKYVTWAIIAAMVVMGFDWAGWWFWVVLTTLIGHRHPPPVDPVSPLFPFHRLMSWMVIIVFIITFMPVPFSFHEGFVE